MRLTEFEADALKEAFKKYFPDSDSLWLFGSRADDSKRGGDIDLYIETSLNDYNDVSNKRVRFLAEIEDKIGEQKIDIVINMLRLRKELRIYQEARDTGVRLA